MDYERTFAPEDKPLIVSVMQLANEAHHPQHPRLRVLSAGTKDGEPFAKVLLDTDQLNKEPSAVLNDQIAESRTREQVLQPNLVPDAAGEQQTSSMRHPAAELGQENMAR
jgi:hypothetical protein